MTDKEVIYKHFCWEFDGKGGITKGKPEDSIKNGEKSPSTVQPTEQLAGRGRVPTIETFTVEKTKECHNTTRKADWVDRKSTWIKTDLQSEHRRFLRYIRHTADVGV